MCFDGSELILSDTVVQAGVQLLLRVLERETSVGQAVAGVHAGGDLCCWGVIIQLVPASKKMGQEEERPCNHQQHTKYDRN